MCVGRHCSDLSRILASDERVRPGMPRLAAAAALSAAVTSTTVARAPPKPPWRWRRKQRHEIAQRLERERR